MSSATGKSFFLTTSYVEVHYFRAGIKCNFFLKILDDVMTDMLNPHPNEMKIRDTAPLGM